ncbi:hypothetical protein DS745_15895 [Anaerobacillus alkaliphilus]|uniref:Uncharacterized protein n=1 Tax=Anaerobacillus alkaliphilus TaxID=1548597 RepID=A0A4Q0VN79_9BACI|nr:hypothetical protein [Anaerobacillus alkaliphilus]RXI97842.1 hypothetical protein DS745_15895 [Anaerobacillus alkaliphilus]
MSWLMLYRKELRLTRTKFMINIGFLLALVAILWVLIERYNPAFIALIVPVVLVHLFYLFFAMLDSLRQEWKQKTTVFWLNIPTSGWQLLTAKFVAATTQLVVSLSLTLLFLYILLQRSINHFIDSTIANFILEQYQSYWWILFFGILIASLQAGGVVTFIYMMAKSIRRWGWLVGIAIVIAGSWLWVKFQETVVYRSVTEWGALLSEKNIMETLSFHFDSFKNDPNIHMEVTNNAVLYVGTAVVDVLIVVIILYASAWLLDHKVEA